MSEDYDPLSEEFEALERDARLRLIRERCAAHGHVWATIYSIFGGEERTCTRCGKIERL